MNSGEYPSSELSCHAVFNGDWVILFDNFDLVKDLISKIKKTEKVLPLSSLLRT